MKLAAILLLFLIAAGLIYIFVDRTPATPEALAGPTAPEPGETIPAPLDGPATEVKVEPPSGIEERTPVVESRVVEEETKAAVAPNRLTGSVVLVDESGFEHWKTSGTIEWIKWTGNSGSQENATVTDGAFELDVTGIESLSVAGLVLDEESAMPDDRSQRYPVDQGPIVVRAHRTRLIQLSVLSEETGLHLDQVTMVKSTDGFGRGGKHPGAFRMDATVLTDARSPLEYRPDTSDAHARSKAFFVHSPGFAWMPIQLDLTTGGEREIRLVAGGEVEFLVEGEVPRRKASLRLRRTEETGSVPFVEISVREEGPLEVTGLLPGHYRASVELGEWYDEPMALADAEIEVFAEARGQCILIIEAPVEVVRATLAGTVVVPAEWSLDNFELTAELDGTIPDGGDGKYEVDRSRMEVVDGQEDTWAFEFRRIPTGDYHLELTSGRYPTTVEYGIQVTLGPEGVADARLELPPPGMVVVRFVEAVTGATADITHLHWHLSRSFTSVSREDGADHFEFLAPIGEIHLGCFGDGYDSLDETVRINSGRNDFIFTLERDCPLVILLMDGETPVPFPSGHYFPSPEHLDGEGKLLYTTVGSGGSSGFKTGLSQPGRYVFELPEIPGFEPIPPQTITVARGEETEYVIPLVRKE